MASALTAEAQRHALLRSAALHFVVAAVLVLALTTGLAATLGLGTAFIIKAMGVLVVGSLLFVPVLLRGHPFDHLGPANRITLVRGVLTATLAGFLGEQVSNDASLLIVGLGLTSLILDGFDGHLARRSNMASPFGARFDMETDALLILLFSVLAWQLHKAGSWVILSGLLRYLFVAAAWVLPWMRAPLPQSRRRQTVCVVQIAALLAVLLPFVTYPGSALLAAATLCLLCYSFAVDVIWLARHPSASPLESASRHGTKGPS